MPALATSLLCTRLSRAAPRCALCSRTDAAPGQPRFSRRATPTRAQASLPRRIRHHHLLSSRPKRASAESRDPGAAVGARCPGSRICADAHSGMTAGSTCAASNQTEFGVWRLRHRLTSSGQDPGQSRSRAMSGNAKRVVLTPGMPDAAMTAASAFCVPGWRAAPVRCLAACRRRTASSAQRAPRHD
jgi:hypothetical protein